MEVVYPRCCGLDVHKHSISACVIIREHGKAEKLERRFGTLTHPLEDLAEWLEEFGVTHVVMEATGVYWKPVCNPWLRSAICEAAWAASHTKKSYCHAQYARICARRGPKRALMAVAHSMIIVGFYLIKHDLEFKDLGADFFDRRNREHVTGRAVKRLNALGYKVHLQEAVSVPS